MHKPTTRVHMAHRLDQYAELTEETLTIPGDLTELSDSEIFALENKVAEAFAAKYTANPSNEEIAELEQLAGDVEAVQTEAQARKDAAEERSQKAAALAEKLGVNKADEAGTEETEAEETQETVEEPAAANGDAVEGEVVEAEPVEEPAEEPKQFARRTRSIRVPKRRISDVPAEDKKQDGFIFAASGVKGYDAGAEISLNEATKIVSDRLASVNISNYAAAARNGVALSNQTGVFSIRKPYAPEVMVSGDSKEELERAVAYATDQERLQGGSLVAAGGWCAPSEVIYDRIVEGESLDGILSLPEIVLTRGGITRSLGPNFASLYQSIAGFHYTEAEDAAGNYDGQGGGEKPCYTVPCPEFEEYRLELDGLCITAGLLQRRTYPEFIARAIRGALVAHRHRISGLNIAAMVKGSTAVTMPSVEAATASILNAIELQVEHMRASNRLSHDTVLEAIFPYWVRGAIRADLSARGGVDLIDVSNEKIQGWFAQRGVNAQFVYNWQDPAQKASTDFTGWGSTLQFLLYPAGTWVRGTNEVITLDTLFDSQNLRTNDYTALFTEEGSVVVPMGHDSRVVTVPLVVSGATGSNKALTREGVALEGFPGTAFAEPVPALEPVTPEAPAAG